MTIFQSREEIQTDHTLELLELPCLRRLDLIDVNFRVSQLPNTTTTLHLRNMLFTFDSISEAQCYRSLEIWGSRGIRDLPWWMTWHSWYEITITSGLSDWCRRIALKLLTRSSSCQRPHWVWYIFVRLLMALRRWVSGSYCHKRDPIETPVVTDSRDIGFKALVHYHDPLNLIRSTVQLYI